MKNLKHKKHRNTGLIYEMLTRRLTYEILAGKDMSSVDIIRKYFSAGKELYKELALYKALHDERYSNRDDAKSLLESVRDVRNNLDRDKLQKEKYYLIKEIKETIGFDNLFSIEVPDYTVYASIYNLMEYKDVDDPVYMNKSKSSLLEHITKKEGGIEEGIYKDDPNLLDTTFKIFIKKFNDKYSTLQPSQKSLLKEYIHTPDNSPEFKEYFLKECDYIKGKLSKFIVYNTDESLSVKIESILELLDNMDELNFIKEEHINCLMKYQELLKELNIKDGRSFK